MKTQPSRAGLAFGALLCAPPSSHAQPSGDLEIVEPGFVVQALDPGVGVTQLECSPGGVWGEFVYVADGPSGRIKRIGFDDRVTLFTAGFDFPVGLAFGPGPAGNYGNFIYVSEFLGGRVRRVNSTGQVLPFIDVDGFPASNAFDAVGFYGIDMFLVENMLDGPIVTIDADGDKSVFADIPSAYLKFAPGGAWGIGLYATFHGKDQGIVWINRNRSVTPFVGDFLAPQGFDWAFGSIFGGDLFATDVAAGAIYRIGPNGSRSLWALVPEPADVAFCNDALYVASAVGGCYKVTIRCLADLNQDGVVGFFDLLVLLNGWDGPGADLDGDGVVGFQDLVFLLARWGPCPK